MARGELPERGLVSRNPNPNPHSNLGGCRQEGALHLLELRAQRIDDLVGLGFARLRGLGLALRLVRIRVRTDREEVE